MSGWRRVAVVAAVVVGLHAALLLALRLQPAHAPEERSLVVTEATLIEPPMPAPPFHNKAAPTPPPPAVAKAPPPRRAAQQPARPASARPRPQALAQTEAAASSPLIPQPATPPAAAADYEAPSAIADAPAHGPAATGDSDSASIDNGRADTAPGGSGPQIHPPVRLDFEMVALRGVQPWKGVFGQLDWRQDGDRYEAKLALKVLFRTVRAQASTGRISGTALLPERFSETRREQETAELRRGESKVYFSNGAPSEELKPGVQDRLSVVMQLGSMLAADASRHPPGSRIPMQVVGIKDAEDWTFEVLEDGTITVPAGQFQARHLIRTPRRPDDYRMDIWLAPQLGYLPVQMRQTQQNGDVIDLLLRSVSPL